ncbi:MAG: hypothetical protein BGP04_23430 [Rhizobiales bacterium 62-17]|nr:MAG: hypothetical protein BGP04_23430 [Rhizobiales bacterium 62-17]
MSWDTLNAYFDGELAPSEAAEVAAAIARDPRLAERLATLSHLHATTQLQHPEVPPPALILPRQRRPKWVLSMAAALVLVSCIGFIAVRFFNPAPTTGGELAAAIAAHRHWIAGQPAGAPGQRIQVDLPSAQIGRLPDLRASALELSYLSLDPTSREGGLLAGYRGQHGCRLGLWVAPHSRHWGETPSPADRDGLRIRAWSTPDADYALLSRGMDPARLDRFADLIAKLTHQKQMPTEEQLAALRDVPNIGQACDA